MAWSEEQKANAQVIYNVGIQLGASLRDIQVALAAAIVESGLRNLDYGDRDSIGLFQQRDAWGSRSARLDPYQSARMFFLGGNAGQEGLLDISNRESRSIGDLAQDVQVSAFPERYGQQADAAGALLNSLDPDAEYSPQAEAPVIPGTLGAVPGLPPEATVQSELESPSEPSVLEVNGLGEVTADESGIGTLTFGDPFVDGLTFDGASGDAAQGRARAAHSPTFNQVQIPTLADYGIVTTADGSVVTGGTPSAGGETFHGSFAGKDPYDLTQVDGKSVDYMTAAALRAASKEFGAEFSIMQGSHSTAVAASGGTHAGGGVVDLSVPNGDWEGAVRALRKIGFAAWARNIPGHGYAGSGAHIHAVLVGHEELSPQAAVQVQSYLNNDDGLSGSRPDDGPRDYVNNRFVWGDALEMEPERQRVLREAEALLGVPHKWGGEDHSGVDDAGLLKRTYGHLGVDVPRWLLNDFDADPEPIENAKLGDLIAWDNGKRFGIYAGDGQMVFSGGPGSAVQLGYVDNLGDAFSLRVPRLARDMAYGDPGPNYEPKEAPPYQTEPVYPMQTSSGSAHPTGGGYTPDAGSTSGSRDHDKGPKGQGGGTNHGDGNWHPTPDGGGYIG